MKLRRLVVGVDKLLRDTATAQRYAESGVAENAGGIPWPWNIPEGEWTWERYCQLPEDGNRYEVIGGSLHMSPSPGRKHQRISLKLSVKLGLWTEETKSGEVYAAPFNVILSFLPPRQHYLEPDLFFVSNDRLSIITEDNVQGPRDLVIEILSKHTTRNDWVDKRTAYEAGGVAHYWAIDPDKKVLTAFRLEEGKYRQAGRHEGDATFSPEGFPGLEINLGEFWGD